MFSGDFEPAAQGYDRAWALWESIEKPAWHGGLMISQGHYRMQSAYNLWFLGHADRALERASVATVMAHESGSKFILL